MASGLFTSHSVKVFRLFTFNHGSMNNREQATLRAHKAAERDFNSDLPCDPTRHNARINSAFATWYNARYEELTYENESAEYWDQMVQYDKLSDNQ